MTEKQIDEIKSIGYWELTITDEIDMMAYFLYCKSIYKQKRMVLTHTNPPVLDQNYFQTSKLKKQYEEKAIHILRENKIKNLINVINK